MPTHPIKFNSQRQPHHDQRFHCNQDYRLHSGGDRSGRHSLQLYSEVKTLRGLKGARNLQFGGIAVSSATTAGETTSTGSLLPGAFLSALPQLGAAGAGISQGTSYGTSSTNSQGFGNSLAQGAASGAGNSTSKVLGGISPNALAKNHGRGTQPEAIFGQGFTDFAASGGGVGTFGSPILIPGTGTPAIPGSAGSTGGGGKGKSKDGGDDIATVAAVAAVAPVVIGALQTGGGGGGFGFTLGGGVGNVTNVDLGYSQAYGTVQTTGFGTGQGQSAFGQAGGSGDGSSSGTGGGALKPVLGAGGATGAEFLTTTLFNGTGGGLASGGAGGYVGFNPNTPVLFGNFPLGP